MRLYYRLSDNSYQKIKLPGADKRTCFENFRLVFDKAGPLHVLADRCRPDTVAWLPTTANVRLTETDLGNAGSLMRALETALTEARPEEICYFSEDDYLYRSGSARLLDEGILRADYLTLYDHPDKYTRYYDGGEVSKVVRTASSHWRYTVSTCMTFAARARTIREDLDVWHKHTVGPHPHDHFIFKELQEKGRRLAVAIPGVACHTDLTFSGEAGEILIEPWAIGMMERLLSKRLIDLVSIGADSEGHLRQTLKDKTGWARLVGLDMIIKELAQQKKADADASAFSCNQTEAQ